MNKKINTVVGFIMSVVCSGLIGGIAGVVLSRKLILL